MHVNVTKSYQSKEVIKQGLSWLNIQDWFYSYYKEILYYSLTTFVSNTFLGNVSPFHEESVRVNYNCNMKY